MKRFFWIIGVLICMPLAACDDNNPETTDSAVVYTAEGSVNAGDVEKSITLYTTCDWTAAGDEWITVEPAGGSRGIFAVRLSFGANGTGSPRTGTVTLPPAPAKKPIHSPRKPNNGDCYGRKRTTTPNPEFHLCTARYSDLRQACFQAMDGGSGAESGG